MLKRTYRLEQALTREVLERFVNLNASMPFMPRGLNFERTEWLEQLNRDYSMSRSVKEGMGQFAYATPGEVIASEMLLKICHYDHLCEAIYRDDLSEFAYIPIGEHEKTVRKLEVAIDSYFAGLCKIMRKYELLEAVAPNKVDARTESPPEMENNRFIPKLNRQTEAILKCLDNEGYDLLNLTPFRNGTKDKDRAAIWHKLTSDTQLFPSKQSFNTAWRYLIEIEQIAYKEE